MITELAQEERRRGRVTRMWRGGKTGKMIRIDDDGREGRVRCVRNATGGRHDQSLGV